MPPMGPSWLPCKLQTCDGNVRRSVIATLTKLQTCTNNGSDPYSMVVIVLLIFRASAIAIPPSEPSSVHPKLHTNGGIKVLDDQKFCYRRGNDG